MFFLQVKSEISLREKEHSEQKKLIELRREREREKEKKLAAMSNEVTFKTKIGAYTMTPPISGLNVLLYFSSNEYI